ncbi:Tar ligand binding domain-containing protein [Shigella flexneri]
MPRHPHHSTAAAAINVLRYLSQCAGELIQLLGAGKINEFFDQPTQGYQDGFEKQYVAYMEQNNRLYDIAVAITMPPTARRCGFWWA